jgi:hypothetical protein
MTEFGSLDLDEVVGEGSRLSEGGQSNFLDQFLPMPEVKPGTTGTVAVRILPPAKGAKLFQYNRIHTINGRKVHCPRPLVNGKWDRNVNCPICNYYTQLWKEVDQLDAQGRVADANRLKAEARNLKPVERYYYNAIARSAVVDGETKHNVGPRILSIGKILHTMIIRAMVGEEGDPDSKLGNITDLKNGYDFIIRKEVTSGDGFPKYERSGFARNPSPAGEPEEIKNWAASLHDLTKLRNPKELEVLEKELAIHRGLIEDDDVSFNKDEFDNKWGKKSNVSTAPPVTAEKTETVVQDVSSVVESMDAPIEDEEFMKELENMG